MVDRKTKIDNLLASCNILEDTCCKEIFYRAKPCLASPEKLLGGWVDNP